MPIPSFVSSSGVTVINSIAPVVVPAPAGTVADSLLVAFSSYRNIRILGDAARFDPPAGWALLGVTAFQFNVAQALPDHQGDFRVSYRFIPAASAGSEPTSYTFTPQNSDLFGNPSSNPLNPVGLAVVIVRYANADPIDPIHNFSISRFGIVGPVVTFVSTTTYPPISSINNARLVRFTGLTSLATVTPSVPMIERYDVQNSGAPASQAITLSSSDDVLSRGIPSARTVTWDNPAVWSDSYLIIRPSSEPPDLTGSWTFLPDVAIATDNSLPTGIGVIASKFDNFLYVIYRTVDLTEVFGLKINRTTGALVLTQSLGNIPIFDTPYKALVAMDVGPDGVYIVDDDFIVRKFSLTFTPLVTSAAYSTYSLDVVVGSGLSAGKIWNLTEATVRRYDASTLAFVDEVSPASWEPSTNFHSTQGVLDASGNLWVVSESIDMTMSRLSFISAATMSVTHYDITATFPGTAFSIAFDATKNALFIANTFINEQLFIARGQVSKWDIATLSFTESFFSEKAFMLSRSGFKFGASQCVLPLALPANPPFSSFCLPEGVEASETVMLCTGNLSLAARFPTPPISELSIVEAIFDSTQTPDYVWGVFWDEPNFVFRLAYLNTQTTIDCCDQFPPPIPPPTPLLPPGQGFCVPISIPFAQSIERYCRGKGRDRRSVCQ